MKNSTNLKLLSLSLFLLVFSISSIAQQSIARQWNEVMLNCIRKDQARPTVQAHRLAHAGIIMYDAWAVYDDDAKPFFLGNEWGGYAVPFVGIEIPEDVQAAQEECISYAMYRFLMSRYSGVPANNLLVVQGYINGLMNSKGYNPGITSTDYTDGSPAKLGNYIAEQMQLYALQDGSNMGNNYANLVYEPVNGQIQPQLPGNPNCYDPNRWQSLCLSLNCDQNFPDTCVVIPCNAPALSPEFGEVNPFALTTDDLTIVQRDGHDWKVYHDPGHPPYLDTTVQTGLEDPFKFGFALNSIWHSMHTADDGVMIDISPASIGNVLDYPDSPAEYPSFYDMFNGGDTGEGYDINPKTGLPYEQQIVPRGDYTRVLSEYWADGPQSETPPGHWFKIINEVNDHPEMEKRWQGQGEIIDDLEWDVRCYLALGGGILDAAIACWGAKGAYDYTRPIMAIRKLCEYGQSSDPELPHYHPAGMPLIPGFIELVNEGDELAGENNEHVGKIKLYTWKGPEAATGLNGVGWILGENWWTYQRATFVTPPFPGYYSGHSTYSRTAAEVLTLITGDEYFPGGMGEFVAQPNEYLLAEVGPTVQVKLQWAKYRDASDQCSLSRIFGGLHPPQDDIPGRVVGSIVGPEAFNKANSFIQANYPHIASITPSATLINDAAVGSAFDLTVSFTKAMDTAVNPEVVVSAGDPSQTLMLQGTEWLDAMTYVLHFDVMDANEEIAMVKWSISSAQDAEGNVVIPAQSAGISIDTRNPMVEDFASTTNAINIAQSGPSSLAITVSFDEAMDAGSTPVFVWSDANVNNDVTLNTAESGWADNQTYEAIFNVAANGIEVSDVSLAITAFMDEAGNNSVQYDEVAWFDIDTDAPEASLDVASFALSDLNVGSGINSITVTFDQSMNTSVMPQLVFAGADPVDYGMTINDEMSGWSDDMHYTFVFDLADLNNQFYGIEISAENGEDAAGNLATGATASDLLDIDTKAPAVDMISSNALLVNDGVSLFTINVIFDEPMDTDANVIVSFPSEIPGSALSFNASQSGWTNDNTTYFAAYDVIDTGLELEDIDVSASGGSDPLGNEATGMISANYFDIDTRNPEVLVFTANEYEITDANIGPGNFSLVLVFDEEMDEDSDPIITFPVENPLGALSYNANQSEWLNSTTYVAKYNVASTVFALTNIDVNVAGLQDLAGNDQVTVSEADFFDISLGVGVDEAVSLETALYPNPVSSGQDVVLQMTQIPAELQVAWINGAGQILEVSSVRDQSGSSIRFGTADLAAGIYFVHLNYAGVSETLKVQIVK